MMPTVTPDLGPLPLANSEPTLPKQDRNRVRHALPVTRIVTNEHYRHNVSACQLNKPQYGPCLLTPSAEVGLSK
jgi:hypothetical protein